MLISPFEMPNSDIYSRTYELYAPTSPRFVQMSFRDHKPMTWRGRGRKINPNAAKQAAAKRARKITRRRP